MGTAQVKPQKNRSTLSADLIAGLTTSIPAIPDAMASGVLAGVSPINGLYGLMIGTPVAAIFTGSAFMNVSATSAISITIGSGLAGYQGDQLIPALVTIALVMGVIQILSGILRLGFLVRFVSNAVMTGLLTGLGVLVVLSQLGDLTGYSSEYSNKVVKAIDLLFHLDQVDVPTTIVGLLAIALILVFDRTRLNKFSMLLALIIVSILPAIFGWDSVLLVGQTADIPSGFPRPVIPTPIWDINLITVGIAAAVIAMIQGAGVSLGYPNPDGKYPDVSRDFTGQGIANVAVGFFQGLPVGGSLSSTALVISAGAKTRLANIFTGLIAIGAVLLFAPLIEVLPMSGLAAILIVAGVQSINLPRINMVRHTGLFPTILMVFTFIATLVVQIQFAVLLGVLLSILLYVFRASERVVVNEIVPLGGGRYEEHPAPKQLTSSQLMILTPKGSLFFAGATEFEENLPKVEDAHGMAVILRLRGRDEVGSTFMRVLDRYAKAIQANNGRLILAGVSKNVYLQLQKTGLLDTLGSENVYRATTIMGDSALSAVEDAKRWLESSNQDNPR